jgi:hypothetical protein
MPMDDHAREMLMLAGLTYRGFFVGRIPGAKAALLDATLRSGLASYARSWTPEWGPATSHLVEDQYDSSAMFAVSATGDPTHWVIAVRGTNPISFTDWLFGDFDVSRTVAWPFDAGARVSMSTALGLRDLLKLAWLPEAHPGLLSRLVSSHLPHLPPALQGDGRRLELFEWVRDQIEGRLVEVFSDAASEAQLAAIVERICTRRASAHVDLDGSLLRRLAKAAADAKKASKRLDVVVTGHSKGGALAPAFALWLSDTRSVPGGGWDTDRSSRVRYAAFAGPTPGDAAFAERVTREVGEQSCRVVNTNDLVTHAWETGDMNAVAELHGGRLRHLAPLLAQVTDRLAKLGAVYGHVGVPTHTFAGKPSGAPSLGLEIVHQHMDAYLVEACQPGASPLGALNLFVH